MKREDCKVGMVISFGSRNGQQTRARVIKLNLKTAKVETLESRGRNRLIGQAWNVHYGLMTPDEQDSDLSFGPGRKQLQEWLSQQRAKCMWFEVVHQIGTMCCYQISTGIFLIMFYDHGGWDAYTQIPDVEVDKTLEKLEQFCHGVPQEEKGATVSPVRETG